MVPLFGRRSKIDTSQGFFWSLRGESRLAHRQMILFVDPQSITYAVEGFRDNLITIPWENFIGLGVCRDPYEMSIECRRPPGIPDEALVARATLDHPVRAGLPLNLDRMWAVLRFPPDRMAGAVLAHVANHADPYLEFTGDAVDERVHSEHWFVVPDPGCIDAT